MRANYKCIHNYIEKNLFQHHVEFTFDFGTTVPASVLGAYTENVIEVFFDNYMHCIEEMMIKLVMLCLSCERS